RQLEAAEAFRTAAARETGSRALELRRRVAAELINSGRTEEGFAVMTEVLAAAGFHWPKPRMHALATVLWLRIRLRVRGLHFTLRPSHELAPEVRFRLDVLRTAALAMIATDLLGAFEFQTRHMLSSLAAGELHHLASAMTKEMVFAIVVGASKRRAQKLVQL